MTSPVVDLFHSREKDIFSKLAKELPDVQKAQDYIMHTLCYDLVSIIPDNTNCRRRGTKWKRIKQHK